jgi:hypothetical protein
MGSGTNHPEYTGEAYPGNKPRELEGENSNPYRYKNNANYDDNNKH